MLVIMKVYGLLSRFFGVNVQNNMIKVIVIGGIRLNSFFFMIDYFWFDFSEEYVFVQFSESVCQGQVVK